MIVKVEDNPRYGYGNVFYNKKLMIITTDRDGVKEPNFRIIDSDNNQYICRISLTEAKYINYDRKLSKQEINCLIKHLNKSNKHVLDNINWNLLIFSWNLNNSRKIKRGKMPNYNLLKD